MHVQACNGKFTAISFSPRGIFLLAGLSNSCLLEYVRTSVYTNVFLSVIMDIADVQRLLVLQTSKSQKKTC